MHLNNGDHQTIWQLAYEEYISKMYGYLWTQRPILMLVWYSTQMEHMLRELGRWALKADGAVGT
jgi:hypothetical protein